ncbi:MAG TPA: hypothetical protein VM290_00180 [Gaiellaceae bacterium]|nr:hypothetical protein [Gaiellaceae bacterium]
MIRRAALVGLVLALAGCGSGERGAGDPAEPAATPAPPHVSPDGPVTVLLEDAGGLGVSGEVTLSSAGPERTDVSFAVDGSDGAAFSASIREGSCGALGGVAHDLGAVEGDGATLAADVALETLLSSRHSVVLSAAEGDGVVACAELPYRAG